MRRSLLALAVGVALATAGPTGPADAATGPPAALGWWTQRPGAGPLGEGALEVASSVRGDESVAAVRVVVDSGAAEPRLVLTEVPGVAPADGAGFRACRVTGEWEPADAGAWDARPAADCAGATEAIRVDPQHWAVDVAPLLAGGTEVDVALVPSPQELVPDVDAPRTFTLAFSGVEVITGGRAGGIPPGSVVPPVPTVPSTSPAAPVAAGGPRPAPLSVPVPPVAAPTTGAPAGAPAGAGAPTTTAAADRVTIDAPTFDLAGDDGDSRPWGRLLLLVPLSAAAGVAAAQTRRRIRNEPVAETSSNRPLASAGR